VAPSFAAGVFHGAGLLRPRPRFLTDSEGWFTRAAPFEGPASYRLARLLADGSWEAGIEVPAGVGVSLGPGA